MHLLRSQFVVLAVAFLCASAAAQNAPSTTPVADAAANVHLEPHDGQTHFKLGDPIILDLVFTGPSTKYIVKADNSPYLPPTDQIEIAPADGWVRTHNITSRNLPVNLSAIGSLDADPVRVPVLVNRTITFQHPGQYQIAITTDRLRLAETILKGQTPDQQQCLACRTTNAIAIEIADRDAAEESALVAALTYQIESAKDTTPASVLTAPEQQEEREQMEHEISEFLLGADRSDEDKAHDAALIAKWTAAVNKQEAALQARIDARREAAIKLASLPGDDAIRAKVHFIATSDATGDPNPIDWLIVNGLPNSGNKQLQFDLLEQAWRDPQIIPTYPLHTALRQARELTHSQTVTDEAVLWAGTPEDRAARLTEAQSDINDLIATLPQRSEENRIKTVEYLKQLNVPNPFNRLEARR